MCTYMGMPVWHKWEFCEKSRSVERYREKRHANWNHPLNGQNWRSTNWWRVADAGKYEKIQEQIFLVYKMYTCTHLRCYSTLRLSFSLDSGVAFQAFHVTLCRGRQVVRQQFRLLRLVKCLHMHRRIHATVGV